MSVNSNSLGQKSDKMDAAIEAMEARNGAEPPRGPKPEATASNSTAIAILKQQIEMTQTAYSFAKEHARQLRLALDQADQIHFNLAGQERKQVQALHTIAKAEGMSDEQVQSLMHEMNQNCDEEECQDCCGEFAGHEYDSSEGGYCLNCNHHPHD